MIVRIVWSSWLSSEGFSMTVFAAWDGEAWVDGNTPSSPLLGCVCLN